MIELFKKIYTDDKFRIKSPLPLHDAIDRIQSLAISEFDILNSSIYTSEYKLRGSISLNNIRLRLTRSGSVNALSKILYGKIFIYDNGSLLEGTFKVHRFVKIFIPIWFAFAITFFISTLLLVIFTQSSLFDQVFFLLIAILLLLFGFGFIYYAASWGSKDTQIISDLLKRYLTIDT